MVLSPCRDSISGFLGCFQSGGAFSGPKTATSIKSVSINVPFSAKQCGKPGIGPTYLHHP